ncbi:MAG: tRNA (adenosine(37)-N6)-dimethylallyltransferase MiaA [Candidatus Moranbacteria bacterium RIFCSPHIGHO2_01_FULL_54_31]|nr:MAG: tRNA (adenosine(37)-N6)-dimethylallyltransferase MiaA [Candidatus Moranbacteria bacterium RIFCSPHIGHO2_01_FULL_54_31]
MKKTPLKTIVIVGPTAAGKSDLAILLARRYGGEIISADSRQVYRGMDIGSGKVPRDRRHPKLDLGSKKPSGEAYYSEKIPHWLIDVTSPARIYNVTHFVRDAKKAIANIRKRGKVPIICGGTGFWVQALIEGSSFPAVKPDATLRKKLGTLSAAELFVLLQKKDRQRAATIDKHNKVRLIRALEIVETLGKVPQAVSNQQLTVNEKEYAIIGLSPSKETLHKNIEVRLEKRLRKGMVAEVKRLREAGLSWKRLESFGLEYRSIALLLQGKITKEEMKEKLNFEIRHYAKRQLTWLRRFEKMGAHIHWIKNLQKALHIVEKK